MALKAHLEHGSIHALPNDARKAERRALFLEVSGVLPGGLEANVLVHNISTTGLLMETEVALGENEKLMLDLPEAGAVRATIVWHSGFLFGCAFEQALDPKAMAAVELRADPAVEAVVPISKPLPNRLGLSSIVFGVSAVLLWRRSPQCLGLASRRSGHGKRAKHGPCPTGLRRLHRCWGWK